MKFLVCAVRDAVPGEFSSINLEVSEASAYRSFSSAVMSAQANENGLLFSHPEDFSLWQIGEFDSETGLLTPTQNVRICEAGEI